jgi:GNAT superfamily N-acetyltransferase
MSDIIYYIEDPRLANETLNALFGSAWPEHVHRDFGPILARSLGCVGAFEGEQLRGFVNVATDGGVHAFLLDPTVDPAWRHRGIGSQLVQRAAKLAAARGCKWLHVDYEERLAPFYRAAGFGPTAAGLRAL